MYTHIYTDTRDHNKLSSPTLLSDDTYFMSLYSSHSYDKCIIYSLGLKFLKIVWEVCWHWGSKVNI